MDLAGKVDVPAIGPVNKKILIGVGGSAALYIGFMFYKSRTALDDAGDTAVDPGMEDPGTIPSVSGAVSDDNSYGSGTTPTTSTDDYGFSGTTNSQWSQYVSTQLAQSDRWSYTDIVEALGKFLDGKPLSTIQQSIVQAAIAIGNYPPVGTHVIVPGGNTAITVAPTGLHVTTTSTTAVLTFSAVAGADSYSAYRSGTGSTAVGVGNGTSITVAGLLPSTTYSFTVAARSGSGTVGPKSSPVTAKTKAVSIAKPTGLRATIVTRNSVTLTCNKIPNAMYYRWYQGSSSTPVATTDGTTHKFSGLSAKKKYALYVAGDTNTATPGPKAGISVTTKSK